MGLRSGYARLHHFRIIIVCCQIHIEMPRKTPKFKKEALFYLRKHDTVRERKWVWKTGHERDEGSGIWGGKWAIFDRVSDQAVVMFIKDWFDVNVKDMKAEKKDSWIYAILNLRGEENPLLARGRISCSRFLKKVRVKASKNNHHRDQQMKMIRVRIFFQYCSKVTIFQSRVHTLQELQCNSLYYYIPKTAE